LCALYGHAGKRCLGRETLCVLLAFEQLVLGGTLLLERLVLLSRLLSGSLFWRSECRLAILDLGCQLIVCILPSGVAVHIASSGDTILLKLLGDA
jgi:hypothetical protein